MENTCYGNVTHPVGDVQIVGANFHVTVGQIIKRGNSRNMRFIFISYLP